MKRFIPTVLLIALMPAAGIASTRVAGGFTFVEHGSNLYKLLQSEGSAAAIDIVIIGDGFKLGEQADFDQAASDFVEELFEFSPYREWSCAFTIWKINLVSNDSGIDHYNSAGALINRNTPLGCSFGSSSQPAATVTGDFDLCRQAVEASEVPGDDYICVIVHDTISHDGAMSYQTEHVTFMSSLYPWGVVMAHELGHQIAGLGDEYPCQTCSPTVLYTDPSNADLNRTYGGTPAIVAPNLSTSSARSSIPWQADISSSTQLPTVPLTACNGEVVGAWEGGGTYRFGVYRPQEYCVMDVVMCQDEDEDHFCQVCSDALEEIFMVRCILPVNIFDLGVLTDNGGLMRFPIPPPCTQCPDSTLLEDAIRIAIFAERFGPFVPHLPRLVVYDDWGMRVADNSDVRDGRLEVSFRRNRARSYVGALYVDPNARDLEIQSEMYVNGVRMELRLR
jgi:IgA Peptidase M64